MPEDWDGGEDEFEDLGELADADDADGEEEGGYWITVAGLQLAVDEAGKRHDAAESPSNEQYLAVLDLMIFAQYAMMRGWEMINRLVIGADG